MTANQLDELDRLEKRSKPRPWGTAVTTWGDLREHALLLCAMRNALPELLAMARQLLRAREAALPVRVYLAADADVPRDHLCELLDALDGKAEK